MQGKAKDAGGLTPAKDDNAAMRALYPRTFARNSGDCYNLRGRLILADKGYDSDKFVRWVEERGGIVVIPSRANARHPRQTDWHTYKERHLVENLFLKLKNNRRFATRYEKKALCFRAVVCLACSLVWLL